MFKLYITTVIIWFIVLIDQSIVFYEPFKKAQKKIKKETNNEDIKEWGNIKTTLWYLLVSFIPFVRLIAFISKIIMITDTNKIIEEIRRKENGE